MPRPENGIYIIQGEVSLVVTAMRRSSRWTSHTHQDDDQDPLLSSFSQLKDVLNSVAGLDDLAPIEFLGPFLEVIRSEDTTGPITGLALTSVNKFLSYGLIDPCHDTASAAIANIAEAVTHARFVGTDPSSDEVVLMKILHVLRTLLLTPAGAQLSNESVCEIMQSCFRICFEMRLSELLRKSAEHTLMDMVQLLFSRLPQFKDDTKWANTISKKLKMRAGGMESSRSGKKNRKSPKNRHRETQQTVQGGNQCENQDRKTTGPQGHSVGQTRAQTQGQTEPIREEAMNKEESLGVEENQDMSYPEEEILDPEESIATTPIAPGRTVVDIYESFKEKSITEEKNELEDIDQHSSNPSLEQSLSVPGVLKSVGSESEFQNEMDKSSEFGEDVDSISTTDHSDGTSIQDEYVNPRGVRFTASQQHKEGSGPLIPYGLPCVRELFRFLISLTNPLDRHNTDVMIHMGLSLLTVAFESGADHISSFNSLMDLVKDNMCKNLFFLLQSERLTLFAASIRVCFLLFESTRSHLKFQLESYLNKLMDIIVSDSNRVSHEQREIALESIVQLCRIPGLVTELYLNFDCDFYCSNLFEDLMKLLSKNAFPVQGLFNTHLLSLDCLLAVIDSIEQHCSHRMLNSARKTHKDQTIGPAHEACSDETDVQDEALAPPSPPTTGYAMGERINLMKDLEAAEEKNQNKDSQKQPAIRPNRMKTSDNIPTEEDLIAIKHRKKLYQSGTEQFNSKPSKGIAFLQEHGLLTTPLNPTEVATFLRENPKLDKKQIGEYISSKKNMTVMEAYQKTFVYTNTRIDEALRMYLETFRLPGEAPVISYILEQFAENWHKCNGEPFASADAAFTLAYAVIMLNVDQHNSNAKKQNIPMKVHEFKKNLNKVNGGQNFDEEMLNEIFNAIKNEEIVMPAEQTGLVKENYLWKVLLRRGASKESEFKHVPTGAFDRDLFTIVWGPTVAALSFVFDKSIDETIIQKAISGFRKCAMISAHYGLSDVFDNLVISLCKFTTLLSAQEPAEYIPIHFGHNNKAQLAAKTVFGLAHRHGDILREGWKNILDCMLQLYRAKLLPEVLVKVEDFLDSSGRISLVREESTTNQRTETGMFSGFLPWLTMTESTQVRGHSPEEQAAIKQAHMCIEECHVEQLITESKFLTMESLQELIKALISASRCPEVQETMNGVQCEEDAAVLYLELLITVVLQNRDRVSPFWQSIRDHIYNIVVNADKPTFLVERAVVGLLRLAIRLLRREEVAPQVLASLRILLIMKPAVIHSVCQQISFGLHDLLKTNAANIHSSQDWSTLFTLLEVAGAGTDPPPLIEVGQGVNIPESICDAGAQSDSEISGTQSPVSEERGYTSDSELYENQNRHSTSKTSVHEMDIKPIPGHGSWLLVNREDPELRKISQSTNQYNIVLNEELKHSNAKALMKSCETLAFLVRDAAHVTPHNFQSCVHTIRTFVEASIHGGRVHRQGHHKTSSSPKDKHQRKRREDKVKKSKSIPSQLNHTSHDSDDERDSDGYHSLSIQLLDLMHTLHTRAATIYSSWAEEEKHRKDDTVEPYLEGLVENIDAETGTLWVKCWCPLLQGIARLCCDTRRHVRSQALTYLQRALLVHDLQTLTAVEWESCFNKVLFPLLHKLLDSINPSDPNGSEETRMRASTLLCKVFLQHLTPLLSLSTFTALWLTILEFMDKYMHADKSDLLCEAVPESLKNMLLVMHTAGILQSNEAEETQLWKLTWDRIDAFLPNLRNEVFKPHDIDPRKPMEGCSYPGKEEGSTSPVSQQPHSQSPVTVKNAEQIEAGTTRPESPLTSIDGVPASSAYILHPPLPNVTSPAKEGSGQTTVPLVINPDLIKENTFNTQQETPESPQSSTT